MKKLMLIICLGLFLFSCDSSKKSSEGTSENSEISKTDESGIVGSWKQSNQQDVTVNLTFKADGSFTMVGEKTNGRGRVTDSREIKGSWTKNGDAIYLTTPSEKEVGVMEILSLDSKSLVVRFKDDPDDILYFVRK